MLFGFYLFSLGLYWDFIWGNRLVTSCLVIVLVSLANVFLSGTRSSIILVAVVTIFLALLRIKTLITNFRILFIAICAIGLSFLSASTIEKALGLETAVMRLQILEDSQVDFISGEGVNRHGTFQLAHKRLGESNFLIGNGYSFGANYKRITNGTHNSSFIDFHNLYLSLPLFYGWIGAGLLMLLFLIPIPSLLTKRPLSMCFMVFWSIFFVNEYKIQFIRNPQYSMIIWLMLGLTYAFTSQLNKAKSKNMLSKTKSKL
jgi:hypothetical protein